MTPSASLGAALEAFILEHQYCGELDAAVEADRVWMTCTCGAVITETRTVTDSLGPLFVRGVRVMQQPRLQFGAKPAPSPKHAWLAASASA